MSSLIPLHGAHKNFENHRKNPKRQFSTSVEVRYNSKQQQSENALCKLRVSKPRNFSQLTSDLCALIERRVQSTRFKRWH